MKKLIEVFDPPMCCSTGVCGPAVEPKLVHFAADLHWLTSCGVEVRRYNLAHQPMEFANRPAIQQLLSSKGTHALPAILADGKLVLEAAYPNRKELAALAGATCNDDGKAESTAACQCAGGSASTPVQVGMNTKPGEATCCG